MTCIQPLQGKFILWAILSISFLNYSCSDPATVGLELAPGNNQIGVFFQEFDLPAKVVLLDSFNTTNQGVLIVGEEEDPFFGKTSGIGFSRMYIDSSYNSCITYPYSYFNRWSKCSMLLFFIGLY